MLFALVYYAVDARKWFKGPRVNVEHVIYTEAEDSHMSGSDNDERLAEKKS